LDCAHEHQHHNDGAPAGTPSADDRGEARPPLLAFVVPCYNEEEALPSSIEQLSHKLAHLAADGVVDEASRVLFVDDGSHDRTWKVISTTARADARFIGVRLAHNRGHQHALIAGYEEASRFADVAISMDADLQDDLDAVDEMLEKHAKGANIVYGVRADRSSDTAFKRGSAKAFYRFMKRLGTDTIENHADFRLMDKTALAALSEYGESNLFLRGIVPDIGLKTATVSYARKPRTAGSSKYPLSRMLKLAFEGITSFSTKPLHLIGVLGIVAVLIAIVAIVYALVQWACGNVIDGWTTVIISIWFIGGVQLICLAVLGEYVGKIYAESKHRPRYFVQERTFDPDQMRG
jgi:glycosyltransferase involved in cell wall biosynthesis